jgi:CheY-like chemotaxis protein
MVRTGPDDAMRELLALARTCSGLADPEAMVQAAMPALRSVSGADSVLTLGPSAAGPGAGLQVTHRIGVQLDADASVVTTAPAQSGDVVEAPVPSSWRAEGIERVAVRPLAGRSVLLVLAWRSGLPSDTTAVELALALLDSELTRAGEAPTERPVDMEEFERRKALEINDNVVQGLVAASYALDQGQVAECSAYLGRTLTSARSMMDGMLEPHQGQGFKPGDLVRSVPATFGSHEISAAAAHSLPGVDDAYTVLVVDDADDLRMLLRSRMEGRRGLTVVGEAADGLAAVELASELQPDLVMLDLAMPRMDGLEALPLIRAAVPGVRVIVLSGFNQNTLAEKAMQAGADRYVIKGGSMRQLLDLVDTVLDNAS